MNAVVLVPVPPGVVTVILPVVAVFGTVAVICEYESTVKLAFAPLNFTRVAPVSAEPVIVTVVPTGPLAGVNPWTTGTTLNDAEELVPHPAGLTTAILPVVAPEGTIAVMLEYESMVKDAEVPLNLTSVAPVKAEPVIVTVVPTGPLAGLKL